MTAAGLAERVGRQFADPPKIKTGAMVAHRGQDLIRIYGDRDVHPTRRGGKAQGVLRSFLDAGQQGVGELRGLYPAHYKSSRSSVLGFPP